MDHGWEVLWRRWRWRDGSVQRLLTEWVGKWRVWHIDGRQSPEIPLVDRGKPPAQLSVKSFYHTTPAWRDSASKLSFSFDAEQARLGRVKETYNILRLVGQGDVTVRKCCVTVVEPSWVPQRVSQTHNVEVEDSTMMIPIKLHICLAGMFSTSYNFFHVYVLPMMSAIVNFVFYGCLGLSFML